MRQAEVDRELAVVTALLDTSRLRRKSEPCWVGRLFRILDAAKAEAWAHVRDQQEERYILLRMKADHDGATRGEVVKAYATEGKQLIRAGYAERFQPSPRPVWLERVARDLDRLTVACLTQPSS